MTDAQLSTHTLHDPVHGEVPWASLRPEGDGPLPVCIFMYGGGGSLATLEAIAPLLRAAWSGGRLPPMLVACAAVPPFCFYLDDPPRGMRWETLVAQELLGSVRAQFRTNDRVALVGISMGGYGALKIAFAMPQTFDAVAAIAPMVEPGLEPHATSPRHRFFYPADVPAALLGEHRDANLYLADHPASRARRHADAIRARAPAIWMDAGSRDACNAHDGTEWMHRVLWDLDIAHEYHLWRDADHVGASLGPRLQQAFTFVGHHMARPLPEGDQDAAALREALSVARAAALVGDPDVARTYGRLPPSE